MTFPFTYREKHTYRHGPCGYVDNANYRDWLRDEFTYRCVFCLLREQWGRVRGTSALDHFRPVSLHLELKCVYENLRYACVGCNGTKGDRLLTDPLLP